MTPLYIEDCIDMSLYDEIRDAILGMIPSYVAFDLNSIKYENGTAYVSAQAILPPARQVITLEIAP